MGRRTCGLRVAVQAARVHVRSVAFTACLPPHPSLPRFPVSLHCSLSNKTARRSKKEKKFFKDYRGRICESLSFLWSLQETTVVATFGAFGFVKLLVPDFWMFCSGNALNWFWMGHLHFFSGKGLIWAYIHQAVVIGDE